MNDYKLVDDCKLAASGEWSRKGNEPLSRLSI